MNLITRTQYEEIAIETNYYINTNKTDWAQHFLELIVQKTSISHDQLHKIIEEKYQFVETMLFSQLGRPENITIYREND